MKLGKRIVSFLLVVCMLFSCGLTALAADPDQTYSEKQEYRNVALGAEVTGIGGDGTGTNPASVTDGVTDKANPNDYYEIGRGMEQSKDNPYYVQVDLGQVYSVDKINLWRYHFDGRTYHDTVVLASEDDVFDVSDVVFNADDGNILGFGAGTEQDYAETADGREITFEVKNVRYIRVYNNGHTMYDQKGGHYVEIQAWAWADKPVLPIDHAEKPLEIPTFTAEGMLENSLTHPDVIKFDTSWNGYTYYMAVTPNQTGNSQFENPCLVASNDGIHWEIPKGISNPLTGVKEEAKPYHNCDTDIVYQAEEDALYIYYLWSKDSPGYGSSGFHPSEVRLYVVKGDGQGNLTCTENFETVATTTYRYDALSPAVVIGPDGIWRMWAVDTGETGYCNQTNKVVLRTSEDGHNWSAPKSLEKTFDQPGYQPWHINVNYIPELEEYWAIYPCYVDGGSSGYTELFFATSKDGELWTTYEKPLMKPRAGQWDDEFIYRSCFLYEPETDLFRLWYGAGDDNRRWGIGYTETKAEDMIAQLGASHTPERPDPSEDQWEDVWALDGDVELESGWSVHPNEGEHGIACSYEKGAKASLTFHGIGIRWIGQKDSNFGTAIVTLDGEQTEVNTNGAAQWGMTHFEKTGLEEGVHTISVEAKDRGVFDQSGCIDVEKFQVSYDRTKVVNVSELKVEAGMTELYVGDTTTLTSHVKPYNATQKKVTYTSLNPDVASVDANDTLTAKRVGTAVIEATAPGLKTPVKIEVKVKELAHGELRMAIDNEHPLFLHHLYRQTFENLPGPMSGGKDIQGFWDSLKKHDSNGKGISRELLDNQAIIIHASGSVKGNPSTLAWYEEQFEKTTKDQIPFFIMVSNSGTSDGGAYEPPAVEWISKMYDQYPNMMGVIFSENHNATADWQRQARSDYMRQMVMLAAEKGGHVIYSDMNDNGDYVEIVLSDPDLFRILKQCKGNFVLLAKTTSAWSSVSYNAHESVAQGAWLSDIAGNWGSLIDSWMWFIEGFGPLWGDETFSVMGGAEECRGPVSFPELLFEMRMVQQARVGATVFTFEHPDYTTSVGKNNGTDNQFTPAFTESIVKAMEYMTQYHIPTQEEVLSRTKVAYCAEKGTLNDLANAGLHLLNPLYGDTNHNGYNGTTMMVYSTGRYGTVPSLPKLATEADKAKFQKVFNKDTALSELKNEAGVKAYFDQVYPENYQGTGYAQFQDNTWLAYNSNWNIDSRVEEELHAKQDVTVKLKNNKTTAQMAFDPYTLLLVEDKTAGELSFRFNNYLVDKNPIWEGYVVGNGTTTGTHHWDSDHDTGMYDYLFQDYIPDEKTADDIYRQATITLTGLAKKPTLVMERELTNKDGSKQCKAPVETWDAKTGTYTIKLDGNGWQEFKLTSVDAKPKAEDTLRVASFNIASGLGLQDRFDTLNRIMQNQEIDVVGMQEVDQNTNRNDKLDIMQKFLDLGYFTHKHFQKAIDFDGGQYGIGTLSRLPLKDSNGGNLKFAQGTEQRVYQRSVIERDGKQIAFYNVHLTDKPMELRKEQLLQVLDLMDKDTCKYKIMTGDFNVDQYRNELYPALEKYNLANGWDGKWMDTYNAADESMKIFSVDNIIFSRNLHLNEVNMVWNTKASDHNMLYAEFELLEENEPSRQYLDLLVEDAKQLDPNDYEPSNYEILQKKIEEAETLKPDASQEEIDAVRAALQDAMSTHSTEPGEPVACFDVMSDTHIKNETAENYQGLHRAIQNIMKKYPNTLGIFNCGDYTDHGYEDESKVFYDVLDDYKDKVEFTNVLGNHDVRWQSWDEIRERYLRFNAPYMPQDVAEADRVYFDKWLGPDHDQDGKGDYHFIVLNSEYRTTDRSYFSDAQLDWYREKLAEDNEDGTRPVFVFTHEPPKDTIYWSNECSLGEQDGRLKEIMREYPNTILFTGHVHNGIDLVRVEQRDWGYNVDVPGFVSCDQGNPDGQHGWHVTIYEDRVVLDLFDYESNTIVEGHQQTLWIPNRTAKTNGKVLDVDFNDGTAADHSGNGHNGTIHGDVEFVEGPFGDQAVRIQNATDGAAEQYVDFGQLNLDKESFTVMFWYKAEGDSEAERTMFSNKNWSSGGNDGLVFGDMSNGILFNIACEGSGRLEMGRYPDATDGKWHLIAATVDREGRDLTVEHYENAADTHKPDMTEGPIERLFIDGVQVASKKIDSVKDRTIETGLPYVLGADGLHKFGIEDGCFDGLKVYKNVIGAAEMRTLVSPFTVTAEVNSATLTCLPERLDHYWSDNMQIDYVYLDEDVSSKEHTKKIECGSNDPVTFENLKADTSYMLRVVIRDANASTDDITDVYELHFKTKKDPNAPEELDLSKLNQALSDAQKAKKDVKILDKTPNEVEKGTKFVSRKEADKLNAAIKAAEEAKTAQTQKEIDQAAKDLQAAVEAYKKAIQTGTKIEPVTPDVPPIRPVKPVKPDAKPAPSFVDVAKEDWFYDAVTYVAESGLMSGVGNGCFAPQQKTTRAMIVTILYRLEGQPAVYGKNTFSDVAADQWYTDAITWASSNEIVTGYSKETFGPMDQITREQLAAILYRYAQHKGYDVSAAADLNSFTDADQISSWAEPAVKWAVAKGLVNGMDGRLESQGSATRAQVAAILMRFCKKVTA